MAIIQSASLRQRFAAWLTTLRQAITRTLSSRPKVTIAAFGISFVALIAVSFLADLQARYHAAINLATRTARNYAEVLAEDTALTFEAVDRSLRQAQFIRRDLEAALAAPGADEASLRRGANDALKHLQQTSLVLVAIGWTNVSGEVEAHSYMLRPPRSNIADLPHFKAHRDSQDDQLYVSPPNRSAESGRWVIAVSRRLANPDGSFAGVLTALLDQSYFQPLSDARCRFTRCSRAAAPRRWCRSRPRTAYRRQ
jgi:hypothetical protein